METKCEEEDISTLEIENKRGILVLKTEELSDT
jgi:hypothetical protein